MVAAIKGGPAIGPRHRQSAASHMNLNPDKSWSLRRFSGDSTGIDRSCVGATARVSVGRSVVQRGPAMKLDRRRFVTAAAALGLAASARLRRAAAQEPRAKIRIGVVPLISSGPIFVAVAKGFFDKIGLDVELKYFA